MVGTLASAAGCALGHWGAPHLAQMLIDGEAAPSWFTIRPVAWPLHVAFWTGPAVALAGVWAASRRAGRTGPAEALREADVDTGVLPPVRRLLGFALLAGAAFLMTKSLVTDASELLKRKTYTTQPMVLITAAALLAPLLVRPLTRLLRLPGATGMLVRANSAASLRRTAAVAAPVLITVALAGSVLGSATTVSQAKAAEAREHTRADLVVTGEHLKGLEDLKARPVPGATLSASASTAVFVREEGTAVIRSQARAVDDARTLAAVERLPVVAGDLRDLDDRSIVVNEEWEQRTVGATVRVWLGDGRPVSLRIAAVLAIGTGNNGVYVTAANAPTAPVDRIDVRLAPGADRAAVTAVLRGTGGTVRSTDEWLAATHPRTSPQTRLGLIVVLGIALVYTALALANTLLMAGSVRSAELNALRLAGATRPQVLGVVAGETLFAVGLGAVLGMAVTAVNLAGLGAALATLSAPVTVAVQWPVVGVRPGCVQWSRWRRPWHRRPFDTGEPPLPTPSARQAIEDWGPRAGKSSGFREGWGGTAQPPRTGPTPTVSPTCQTQMHDRALGSDRHRDRRSPPRPAGPHGPARGPVPYRARPGGGRPLPPGRHPLGVAVDRRDLPTPARSGRTGQPLLRHRGRRVTPPRTRGPAGRAPLRRGRPCPPP